MVIPLLPHCQYRAYFLSVYVECCVNVYVPPRDIYISSVFTWPGVLSTEILHSRTLCEVEELQSYIMTVCHV